MKRYKHLKEKKIWHDNVTELVGSVQVYLKVFVNPNEYELKACGGNARGIIYKNGDLYVMQSQSKETNYKYVTHTSLISFLNKERFIDGPLAKGQHNFDYVLPVQQVENYPVFGIGESDATKPGINKVAKQFFKLAKQKNEDLTFIAKHVHKITIDEIKKLKITEQHSKSLYESKIINYVAYLVDRNNTIHTYITNIISIEKDTNNSNLLKVEGEGYERQRVSSYGKSTTWNYIKFSKDSRMLSITIPKNFFIKKSGAVKLRSTR
jgi:hypothetical protein